MRDRVLREIAKRKLITIFRGIAPQDCIETVRALLKGGISMVEITFNQKDQDSFLVTQQMIQQITEAFGGEVSVGAGTVVTPQQVLLAKGAGATYIISPDCNPEVIKATRKEEMVSIPGAMTPSEIAAAYHCGADYVKLFPAGVLGKGYVKAICAPLSHIPLLGVGGVSPDNMGELMEAGLVGFGLGGNLVNREWIRAGRFDEITALAKKCVGIVNGRGA